MNQIITEHYIDNMYILLCEGDLPDNVIFSNTIVAIDTELNRNLNPFEGKLCLVQVKDFGANITYLVKFDIKKPYTAPNLAALMEDENTAKLLHFANTDLQFVSLQLRCVPKNILCTRLMSKVIRGQQEKIMHSLSKLVEIYLGISLDKGEQMSKWESPTLTKNQIKYAALDVAHLHDLYFKMMEVATPEQAKEINAKCLAYSDIIQGMLNSKITNDPLYLYVK